MIQELGASQPQRLPFGALALSTTTDTPPFLRPAAWAEVSLTLPETWPSTPPLTLMVPMTSPGTPITGPIFTCAPVASEESPAYLPVMVRVLPDKVAVTFPLPTLFLTVELSKATGSSGVENCRSAAKADV